MRQHELRGPLPDFVAPDPDLGIARVSFSAPAPRRPRCCWGGCEERPPSNSARRPASSARLQRHQAALAAGLTAAIDRGGGLLAEAQDRRDQRAAELDRAAELLHSVAAGIPPAPLPRPRTSQSSTPDRVQ